MKIIFMGTPDLAAAVLKTMLEAGLDVGNEGLRLLYGGDAKTHDSLTSCR